MAKGGTSVLRCASVVVLFLVLSADPVSSNDVWYQMPQVQSDFHEVEVQPLFGFRYRRQAVTTQPPSTSTLPPSTSTLTPSTTSAPRTAAPSTTTSAQPPSTQTPTSTSIPTSTPSTTVPTTRVPTTIPISSSTTPPSTRAPTAAPSNTSTPTPMASTTDLAKVIKDDHKYYKSRIVRGEVDSEWVEMTEMQRHNTLSSSHRTAVTIELKFKFRFYGHNISSITVATGGFIYASPFLHQWLTATQYIAPLMANFDTTLGNESDIFYKDYDNRFIVEWSNVRLKDQESAGPFSFQAHLYETGVIKFLYKQLPISIANISSHNHPVKVGLSDAFYIDTVLQDRGVRRRTIYEYHRVAIGLEKIRAGTVITLNPLRTCNVITDCSDCVTHSDMAFDCKWCTAVDRCSDGLDWHRQEWLNKGCTDSGLSTVESCEALLSSSTTSATKPTVSSTTKPTVTSAMKPTVRSAVPVSHGTTAFSVTPLTSAVNPWSSSPTHAVSLAATTGHSLRTTGSVSIAGTTSGMQKSTADSQFTSPSVGSSTTASRDSSRAGTGVRVPDGTSTLVTGLGEGTSRVPVSTVEVVEATSSLGSGATEISSAPLAVTAAGVVDANCLGGYLGDCDPSIDSGPCPKHNAIPIGGVVAIILVVLVVLGSIGAWFLYAYNNPQSSSGMWLMEHRPSQMKDKIAKIKFWKSSTPSGTKYRVESEA